MIDGSTVSTHASRPVTKSIMCWYYIQNEGCNSKLYMIPGGAISHLSLCLENFCTSWLIRIRWHDDPQGSKKLLDSSRNPLGVTTDFEGQLQELFDEVKTMIKMGNENDAIDLLQANYEAVKEQMDAGARGIKQAAPLHVIALGYIAIGNLKMHGWLPVGHGQLDEVIDGLKDDRLLLDLVLTCMGSMYSASGKLEDSLLAYKRSLEIVEREYGMAKVLGSIRRATKAVEVYHCVITILELSTGAESEDLVVPLLGLGNLLMKEKLWMLKILLLVFNVYTKLNWGNDGIVGMAMCSLAHVKCAKGAADEAIQLYRNALQVLKDSKCMPLDNNVMEKMRIDLAELLHLVGRQRKRSTCCGGVCRSC
ncbi:unnamed protein product [Camellia sinensis]